MPGALGGQNTMSDPLDLEFQMDCDARTETRSSGSIASALKLWAIALAPDLNFW